MRRVEHVEEVKTIAPRLRPTPGAWLAAGASAHPPGSITPGSIVPDETGNRGGACQHSRGPLKEHDTSAVGGGQHLVPIRMQQGQPTARIIIEAFARRPLEAFGVFLGIWERLDVPLWTLTY